ncbi:MAG: hypothetical protein D6730_07465 [Bacteroidetes bacterium]|nr:MAG: hypothetical protein D6730_07465 [Bacteroidota bacterium]
MQTFLLYGANGYTGQLIAEMAGDFGLKPVLAGRSAEKIRPLAERLGCDCTLFSLDDQQAMDQALQQVPVVLHAAGPYKFTARPMMEACLRTGTHYLDSTGEIEVFELGHSLDEAASRADIMLMPGTGFDVVPTDCMALYLKKKLPDATHLRLAFTSLGGGVSHGTATTMAENLGQGGAVRKDGKIVPVPLGHRAFWVPFGDTRRFVMAIPWGDVSTAYYSTGIPNIETYMGISPKAYRYARMQKYFNWLLKTRLVRNMLKKRIDKRPPGPSPEERAYARSLVWGQVSNAKGDKREAWMETPEGYTLTAITSLLITRKVLNGQAPAGFQTPAKAYGEDLILEVEGVKRHDLEPSAISTS